MNKRAAVATSEEVSRVWNPSRVLTAKPWNKLVS
jgi:hypothetical protein